MSLTLAIESPDQPEVRALLAASDAYHAALYPAESNHLLDIAALTAGGARFFVARLDGAVVGIGSVVPTAEGWGEIKRMFVADTARGLKLGRRILARLEDEARTLGLDRLRLETGIAQPEALGLYRAAGYREIPAFPPYQPDPLSLFFEKRLDLHQAVDAVD